MVNIFSIFPKVETPVPSGDTRSLVVKEYSLCYWTGLSESLRIFLWCVHLFSKVMILDDFKSDYLLLSLSVLHSWLCRFPMMNWEGFQFPYALELFLKNGIFFFLKTQ